MAETAFGDVPGYDTFERLAAGGFSVVYRARQVSLDRIVAVKILNLVDIDERAMARFRRECASMGRLSGREHIVPIFDAGTTTSGFPFLSMELVAGGTLADLIARRGALPTDDVARYGIELSRALQAAHENAVLHRDLKPENVLLDRSGRARLADFGIAALEEGSQATSATFAGTVGYMPPEILEGGRPTVASDVYGLGATLYALAAGRAPFRGPNGEAPLAVMARMLRNGADSLSFEGIDAALATVIRTAMSLQPLDRYSSAAALGTALAGMEREHHPTIMQPVIAPPTAPIPAATPAAVACVAPPPASPARQAPPPPPASPARQAPPPVSASVSVPVADLTPTVVNVVVGAVPSGSVSHEAASPARRRRWPLLVAFVLVVGSVAAAVTSYVLHPGWFSR